MVMGHYYSNNRITKAEESGNLNGRNKSTRVLHWDPQHSGWQVSISRHIEQAKARTRELPHKYIQSSSIILLLVLERSRGYSAEYSRSKEHSLFRNYPEWVGQMCSGAHDDWALEYIKSNCFTRIDQNLSMGDFIPFNTCLSVTVAGLWLMMMRSECRVIM